MDKQFNYTEQFPLWEFKKQVNILPHQSKHKTSHIKSEGKFKTCFHNPYIWYSTIYINQEEMIKKFIIQLALDFPSTVWTNVFVSNWWGPDRTRNNLDTRKSLRTKFQLTYKHLQSPAHGSNLKQTSKIPAPRSSLRREEKYCVLYFWFSGASQSNAVCPVSNTDRPW